MASLNNTYENKMYMEWAALDPGELCEHRRWSVLHKLPHINGEHVVCAVVKPLAASLTSLQVTVAPSPSPVSAATLAASEYYHPNAGQVESDSLNYLQTDRDVSWVMEVICYGLSLPLNTTEQHDLVRDSVNIYYEWMLALIPTKRRTVSIPNPIIDDPNRYFRRIIQHIYNVFIPRTTTVTSGIQEQIDVISKQAVLCHRILRRIQEIAQDETSIIDKETWNSLLMFLLAINDKLLSPPSEREDIGTQLCERVVSVLFEIWLISCHRCFPVPSFWKTFQKLCCTWRHRSALVDEWSRTCIILTQRLVQLTNQSSTHATSTSVTSSDHASSVASSTFPTSYKIKILHEMNDETVYQSWFRFLHTLGNPVELSDPSIIYKSLKYSPETVVDPRQHPCLEVLPRVFLKAMTGLSSLVDIFLGLPVSYETGSATSYGQQPQPLTPPYIRKYSAVKQTSVNPVIAKQFPRKQFPNQSQQTPFNVHYQISNSAPPPFFSSSIICKQYDVSNVRPTCNSVLNIFGVALFAAALNGSELIATEQGDAETDLHRSTSSSSFNGSSTTVQENFSRRQSTGVSSDRISIDMSSALTPDSFEEGQAEAIGALCRLFSSKRSSETIESVYLSRFYLCLQHGLSSNCMKYKVMSSILLNSTKLFQLDMRGVTILIPHYLKAMEVVICERDPNKRFPLIPMVELRKACISILLSISAYPLHFNNQGIAKNLLEQDASITFQSLRPQILNVMMAALKNEWDSVNIQMLLAGFLIIVQDNSIFEATNGYVNDADSTKSKLSPFTSENVSLASAESSSLSYMSSLQERRDSGSTPPELTSGIYSDDFVGRGGIPETARGLFNRTLYLVGKILISNLRNDTHVSLAALETLSSLARIKLVNGSECGHPTNVDECKKATKWICDYIVNQCSRPPTAHTKDMHSTIIAAYQSLSVWFHEHAYLLQDRECVAMLMEVIELGITGSKSKTKDGIVTKSQKELKTPSMRVCESAQVLLTYLMNHFGYCPPAPCPPETIIGSCLIDEASVLKDLNLGSMTPEEACKRFKHFVHFAQEDCIIISILNEVSLRHTVAIIRSPYGKFCWSMKLQHLPRRLNGRTMNEYVERPPAKKTLPLSNPITQKYFPDSVEKIPLTHLDTVVPTMEDLIKSSDGRRTSHAKMINIIGRQAQLENVVQRNCNKATNVNECKQPMPSIELDSARLIISHFGFLLPDHIKESSSGRAKPLSLLDSSHSDFASNLKSLDLLSTRTIDTGFVFYVRKGQTQPADIIVNVKSKHSVSIYFLDFLATLGASVNVNEHAGWTGNVATSWRISSESGESKSTVSADHGGCGYDGTHMVLYWGDVSHEIAFIVPSDLGESLESSRGSASECNDCERQSLSSLSDDGTNAVPIAAPRYKMRQSSIVKDGICDTKILIIWLESQDDLQSIPIGSLLSATTTGLETSGNVFKDYFVIYIHRLQNGLFRLTVKGSSARTQPMALPLIDGIVVSKRVLGPYVRVTALNLSRRRRLDADSYQLPHKRRRSKIKEMVEKSGLTINSAELYYSLFS